MACVRKAQPRPEELEATDRQPDLRSVLRWQAEQEVPDRSPAIRRLEVRDFPWHAVRSLHTRYYHTCVIASCQLCAERAAWRRPAGMGKDESAKPDRIEAQPADTDGSFRSSVQVVAEEGEAAIASVEEQGFWGALPSSTTPRSRASTAAGRSPRRHSCRPADRSRQAEIAGEGDCGRPRCYPSSR